LRQVAGQASKHVRPAASLVAAAIAGLIGALALGSPVFAQSATWLTTPTVAGPVGGTLDFNANANWNPATAPGSVTQTGTATFGASTGTNISFSATDSILDGFTFNAGASNYSFTLSGGTNRNTLVFNSVGIVVNGGSASFTNNGGGASQQAIITFNLGSSAGNATFTNNSNGITEFGDTSTAGSATITNNNGITRFGSSPGGPDTATAANATITNINGGATTFSASTTAGRATITNTGGFTLFISKSTAGNANITNNNGGITEFTSGTSTAGNAIITNNAGGRQCGEPNRHTDDCRRSQFSAERILSGAGGCQRQPDQGHDGYGAWRDGAGRGHGRRPGHEEL
jgi:hypothetical protein